MIYAFFFFLSVGHAALARLTYRLVDPIGEILLEWNELSALGRMKTLVVKIGEHFLLRRGPRDVGPGEGRYRRGSPAASISRVLRGRKSIRVRHRRCRGRGPTRGPEILARRRTIPTILYGRLLRDVWPVTRLAVPPRGFRSLVRLVPSRSLDSFVFPRSSSSSTRRDFYFTLTRHCAPGDHRQRRPLPASGTSRWACPAAVPSCRKKRKSIYFYCALTDNFIDLIRWPGSFIFFNRFLSIIAFDCGWIIFLYSDRFFLYTSIILRNDEMINCLSYLFIYTWNCPFDRKYTHVRRHQPYDNKKQYTYLYCVSVDELINFLIRHYNLFLIDFRFWLSWVKCNMLIVY